MTPGASEKRHRSLSGAAFAIASAAIIIMFTGATPARAGDHDFWDWRGSYAGPVYGYWLGAPPYGYYYTAYGPGGPVIGFYDARDYYSYYYGRTDFGYQDTK